MKTRIQQITLGTRIVLALTCGLLAGSLAAETPRQVADLVGMKARNADPQLQRRGYVHIDTQKSGSSSSYGNWWNPSRRECLTVAYTHGNVRSITTSPAFDCNQQGHHLAHDDDKSAVAAAAIIGVAALAGAIAMEHKSHHHEDGNHYQDNTNEVEYERGHRDGLHNHSYDNYNRSDAYDRGYDSGVSQREHNTSYREHSGRYGSGYGRAVEFADLNGARASSADSELSNRGFRNVDGFKSGTTAYTIWYNRSSGQCLQMTVADGRAEDISDIGQHPNCR